MVCSTEVDNQNRNGYQEGDIDIKNLNQMTLALEEAMASRVSGRWLLGPIRTVRKLLTVRKSLLEAREKTQEVWWVESHQGCHLQ